MRKEHFSFSIDDDDVHSRLDGLKEKSFSRFRISFVMLQHPFSELVGGLCYGREKDGQRIIGSPSPGRLSEPCNRRPFRTVLGALYF